MAKIPTDLVTLTDVLQKILDFVKDNSRFVDPSEKQTFLTEREELFLDRALEHLEREGYLKRETKIEGNTTKERYYITYSGLMFIAKGSYNQKFKEEKLNRKFKKTVNTSNLITPILTFLVALVTLFRTFAGCDKPTVVIMRNDNETPTLYRPQSKQKLLTKDSLTQNSNKQTK